MTTTTTTDGAVAADIADATAEAAGAHETATGEMEQAAEGADVEPVVAAAEAAAATAAVNGVVRERRLPKLRLSAAGPSRAYMYSYFTIYFYFFNE